MSLCLFSLSFLLVYRFKGKVKSLLFSKNHNPIFHNPILKYSSAFLKNENENENILFFKTYCKNSSES